MAKENSSIRQRGSMVVIHIHARIKFLQDLKNFLLQFAGVLVAVDIWPKVK
jgi:hypothetical protein